MFQYAGTRLYSQLNKFSWAFPSWDGERLFNGVRPWSRREIIRALVLPTVQLSDMTSTSWSERVLEPLGLWHRSSLKELYEHPRDNTDLYGYLQEDFDIATLRRNADTVRGWFGFKTDIIKAFRDATDKYRPWLAVHIRKGDLVRRGKASSTEDAVSHVQRLRGQRNVFVATDDESIHGRFKDMCPISPNNPLPELPPYTFDFWMLKEADVLIGSGSTFAWWAAFLSGRPEYWSPPLNRTWPSGTTPPIEHRRI